MAFIVCCSDSVLVDFDISWTDGNLPPLCRAVRARVHARLRACVRACVRAPLCAANSCTHANFMQCTPLVDTARCVARSTCYAVAHAVLWMLCCGYCAVDTVLWILCRAVPCRAVPCRAVPCCAVLCRAVPCRAVHACGAYLMVCLRICVSVHLYVRACMHATAQAWMHELQGASVTG